jgi:hypothetical protein
VPQDSTDPPAENDWWLCSQLVSVRVPGSDTDAPIALLEEISASGMRLALEERVPEGAVLQIRAEAFQVQATVSEVLVRTDDFRIEARFQREFRWAPDLWAPDHLYRPSARRSKAAGTS